jgi:prepilin-type N-terminal cleavage/methylation domain-containing protein
MRSFAKQRGGFTLIELLIVVAIIAILAMIAVPNFLEAQTCAKVSRVKADFRAIATALEAYRTDYTGYPSGWPQYVTPISLVPVTTPVAYLSSAYTKDPFKPIRGTTGNWEGDYIYFSYEYDSLWRYVINGGSAGSYPSNLATTQSPWPAFVGWSVTSWGPYRVQTAIEWLVYGQQRQYLIYDPTNGTVSKGGLGYFGGNVPPWCSGIVGG